MSGETSSLKFILVDFFRLPNPLSPLFPLLLFNGFHFLPDIFFDRVLEDTSADPHSLLVNALLKVFHPILLGLLAIDSP